MFIPIQNRFVFGGNIKAVISFFILLIIPTFAQTGTVIGTVTDSISNEPLVGANILVDGTTIGAATNLEGKFELNQVPAGRQILKVSYISYKPKNIEVYIEENKRLETNIKLVFDVLNIDEVTVYSQARGQVEAIRKQLSSNTIVNVVSGERLRELPDPNAADAVGRLPGISIIRDAGEGQQIAIRGLGPQYNSITIDGNRIPSTDLGNRSVNLSMISPQMLSGVEVYKVLRPDMDADAIGGSVNFNFSGASVDHQLRASFSSGLHNQINGIGTYKGSVTASSRFFDNVLGAIATFSVERIDRSSHIFGAAYTILRSAQVGEPYAPIETNSVTLTNRGEIRERYGIGLNLDVKVLDGYIYLNNFFSRLNADAVSTQRIYRVNVNAQDWMFQDRKLNIDVLTSSFGGKHTISNNIFTVDWRLSLNLSVQDRPYDNRVTFREANSLNRNLYRVGMSPEEIPAIFYNNLNNTSIYNLEYWEIEAQERDLAASLNFEIPYRLSENISGYIKTGLKHYDKKRYRNNRAWNVESYMFVERYPSYGIITNSNFPLLYADNGEPSIIPFVNTDPYLILDDQYEMSLKFNRGLTNSMWDNTGNLYRRMLVPRLDDYNARERISAAYIFSELNLGENLMILPGVRYEAENSTYNAIGRDFVAVEAWDDEEWNAHERRLNFLSATRNQEMWFPMVQARYKATDWFDIRIGWTQSTSRPDFSQLTPRRIINSDSRTVNRGNPYVRLPKSTNIDLIFTLYSNRIGLFSLGGFYKDIDNLVYNRQTVAIIPQEMGLPDGARGFTVTEPINNPNLTIVKGVEVEWQSILTWLPSPFSGLVVSANFSRIYSESYYPGFKTVRTPQGQVVIDTFRVAPMVHQPDYVANIALGYDYENFSIRVSMLYQGATLTTIGERPETDQFTEDYLRWDIALKQDFLDGSFSVFINAQNLSNRREFSIQFIEEYPRSMHYYGWIIEGGLNLQL